MISRGEVEMMSPAPQPLNAQRFQRRSRPTVKESLNRVRTNSLGENKPAMAMMAGTVPWTMAPSSRRGVGLSICMAFEGYVCALSV